MIEEKVREVVNNCLENNNMWVDDVKYEKEGNNYFLRIVVDSDNVIDVDKIVEVTKIINPVLDEVDIIKDSYILDISSKEKGE